MKIWPFIRYDFHRSWMLHELKFMHAAGFFSTEFAHKSLDVWWFVDQMDMNMGYHIILHRIAPRAYGHLVLYWYESGLGYNSVYFRIYFRMWYFRIHMWSFQSSNTFFLHYYYHLYVIKKKSVQLRKTCNHPTTAMFHAFMYFRTIS